MRDLAPGRFLVVAAASTLCLVGAAGAAPGDLDPSFGTGGIVTTAIGTGGGAEADALVLQSDGKLVAAGWVWRGGGASDFALARYKRNGILDTSFGDGGIATTSIADQDRAYTVVQQPDGKLVAAGTARLTPAAIVRYNADGSLDTSFGDDGIVTPDIELYPRALAVQADGKIVAAGLTYRGTRGLFGLIRLNVDGTMDESFGKDGLVRTAVGTRFNAAHALVLQNDGKLVAGGVGGKRGGPQTSEFAVARYNPDGSLDSSFSADGKVVTRMGPENDRVEALVVQGDGKLVAGGWTGETTFGPILFALARYTPDGRLDTSFSGDGKVTTSISSRSFARGLVAQSDGKLVAAGESSEEFALARYNADGSLDPTFGGDGIVITPIGPYANATALALQEDGKLVAAGTTRNASTFDWEFALARYDG